MQYFKNVQLAKLCAVSEGAVRHWIKLAREGKLDLQLYEHNDKWYVANTTKNQRLVKDLAVRGEKYKAARKIVTPNPDFYRRYAKRQVIDIISNIDLHREIPMQYDYFGEGAEVWDAYARRLWDEEDGNTLTATVELLQSNFNNLDRLLDGYEHVNVIDIGVGNGLPVKELLTHLLYDQGVLARYIGVDISPEMLEFAGRNIKEWFEGRVAFEPHTRDIAYERFDDLLVDENPSKTANLVLLLGGTLNNFREPDDVLKVIRHSMGRHDFLVTGRKLDSEEARRYFDFYAEPNLPKLPLDHRLMLGSLNIDESLYEAVQGYDEMEHARFIGIKLKQDVAISFDIDGIERSVELNKGDTVLLWRAWHQSALDAINQLDRGGFELVEASTTSDDNYLLTINKIESSRPRLLG